jgi:hypothetical protein
LIPDAALSAKQAISCIQPTSLQAHFRDILGHGQRGLRRSAHLRDRDAGTGFHKSSLAIWKTDNGQFRDYQIYWAGLMSAANRIAEQSWTFPSRYAAWQ